MIGGFLQDTTQDPTLLKEKVSLSLKNRSWGNLHLVNCCGSRSSRMLGLVLPQQLKLPQSAFTPSFFTRRSSCPFTSVLQNRAQSFLVRPPKGSGLVQFFVHKDQSSCSLGLEGMVEAPLDQHTGSVLVTLNSSSGSVLAKFGPELGTVLAPPTTTP